MSDSKNQTSLSLLERIRANDEEAWSKLVTTYSPLLYFWCRRRCELSTEDAADVMQEIFNAVFRSIGSFERSENGNFRGWLRVITTNKIRDFFRRSSKQPVSPGGSDWLRLIEQTSTESSNDDATEEGLVLSGAFKLLETHYKEESRQAFWLVVLEGKTAAEAAEEVGISEQAVWQACYRIRRRLQTELAELESDK